MAIEMKPDSLRGHMWGEWKPYALYDEAWRTKTPWFRHNGWMWRYVWPRPHNPPSPDYAEMGYLMKRGSLFGGRYVVFNRLYYRPWGDGMRAVVKKKLRDDWEENTGAPW